MADFRKSLLLAAVSLAVGVGAASAQSTQCNGNAGVPPLMRNEGVTELTGLISFSCPAGIGLGVANVTVQENATSITSQASPQEPFLTVTGTGATPPAPTTVPGAVFGNTVVFDGVNTAPYANGFTVTIGGIRVNASTIPVSVSSGVFSQATAVLSITNVSIPLNPSFIVGYVVPNAATAAVAPLNLTGATACSTAPTAISLATTVFGTITVAENPLDADVFKPQFPIPGQSTDSESGTGLSGNPGVLAQSGTQIAVGLNIPVGLTVYLPVTINSTSTQLPGALIGTSVLVTGSGSTVAAVPTTGLFYSDTGAPAANLFAFAGTGAAITVYYNVVSSNASYVESYAIPVFAAGSGASGVTAQVALAPLAGPDTPTTVIPEFTGLISPPFAPVFSSGTAQPCQTTLLFPFMTNQAGFDTGFSIASTALDPTGTQTVIANPATPTCQLYFYGDAAPTTLTAPLTIATGFSELHSTVSAEAPGFQGYMMAVCNFVYAHGYAFITDGFMGAGRGLSEGYVANVIGNGQRLGTPSAAVGSNGQPEILGN